jgi:adenine-specific DNA-methyltransferase
MMNDAENMLIEADIVYLDPPYNEHQYSPNYHVLNQIFEIKVDLN